MMYHGVNWGYATCYFHLFARYVGYATMIISAVKFVCWLDKKYMAWKFPERFRKWN